MPRRAAFSLSLVTLLSFTAFAPPLAADVRLPRVIGSNMVLQRDIELPFWGWAEPGEVVTVSIGGNKATVATDSDGKWMARLKPLPVGGPHEVLIKGRTNELKLTGVLVGEVWVCSGQSNMQWSVDRSDNAEAEIAAAKYPDIRLFNIPRVPAGAPQADVEAAWQECAPETIPGFSAVAYYFGRKLHQDLKVPIGLIETAWGGTRIEPWTTLEGFQTVPEVAALAEAAQTQDAAYPQMISDYLALTAALATQDGPPSHPLASNRATTGLYNGMVHPIVPYAIRGAIWYQGESNRGDGEIYRQKMQALINGWRNAWGQGDFPFLFVQLAPYRYDGDPLLLPVIWEAQGLSLLIPNTGMAVTTDIGNVADIHPTNKQEVGRRLALCALAKTYGQRDIAYSGPLYQSMRVEGNRIRVRFSQTGGELKSRDGKPLTWFSIAGADRQFVDAEARIEGTTVVVSSAQVPRPLYVRFAWHHEAEPNLVNAAGLPASPFRSHRF